jgi:hypothetical protein
MSQRLTTVTEPAPDRGPTYQLVMTRLAESESRGLPLWQVKWRPSPAVWTGLGSTNLKSAPYKARRLSLTGRERPFLIRP